MSVRQDLGKVSIVPKGDWNSANTYERLDVVKYGGGSYIAKQDVSVGVEITNTAYWLKIVDKGDQGDQGIQGETGETGNGIATAVLNADYTLTLTFTDGTSYTTPSIRGEKGEKGDDGETPDLSNYVQKTQYATESVAGLVKTKNTRGLDVDANGLVVLHTAAEANINDRNLNSDFYKKTALTLNWIDYAVKKALSTNSLTLSYAEKAAIKSWLGILGAPSSLNRWAFAKSDATHEINSLTGAYEFVWDIGTLSLYKGSTYVKIVNYTNQSGHYANDLCAMVLSDSSYAYIKEDWSESVSIPYVGAAIGCSDIENVNTPIEFYAYVSDDYKLHLAFATIAEDRWSDIEGDFTSIELYL